MRTLHAATLLFSLCVLVPLAAPADLFRVDEDDDDDEEPLPDLGVADIDVNATTEKGKYLGSPCEFTCNSNLHHVYCNSVTERCECEKKFPVKLGPTRGCAKPKRLGEQCYYTHTCSFNDPHASCIQINHNAVCQCKPGFHIVTLQRPYKRVFCAEDLVLLTTDLSALAGVATGIAILAGLICFVLRLFSQARYSRPRHFANANMAPPILFSSETGIPLASNSACGGRSTSRSSQRSGATLVSGYSRRLSSAQGGSRGALVPASRAGAARAAAILLISCHQAHDAASDAVAAAAGVLREEADERASSPASEPPPAEPSDERYDAACSSAPSSPTRFGKAVGRGPFRIFGAGSSRDSGFTVNFKTASYVLGTTSCGRVRYKCVTFVLSHPHHMTHSKLTTEYLVL